MTINKNVFVTDCYLLENGTQSLNKSDTFNHFQNLYKNFQECVNKANQDELCPFCMKDYTTLSSYYTEISNVNEKISYCIDMVDVVCEVFFLFTSLYQYIFF